MRTQKIAESKNSSETDYTSYSTVSLDSHFQHVFLLLTTTSRENLITVLKICVNYTFFDYILIGYF